MFAIAYEKAVHFTHPLVITFRRMNGIVESALGAFIIVNKDGWALTAGHAGQISHYYKIHKKQISEYEKSIDEIRNNTKLDEKHKKKKINKLPKNDNWITDYTYWWGLDHEISAEELCVYDKDDIALVKLNNIKDNYQTVFPTFKKPDNLKPGTSLCKLGFPFHSISASFDSENKLFSLDPQSLPIPRFPIEGIYTRNVIVVDPKDKGRNNKFIETSTPGLKGQSGGPIFDVNGDVWAIQSHTKHMLLGFNPCVKRGDREIEENQFLNVGLGVHPETIIKILTENNIAFELSEI